LITGLKLYKVLVVKLNRMGFYIPGLDNGVKTMLKMMQKV